MPSLEQVEQAQAKTAGERGRGSPRLLQPNRSQIELRASDLESLLPEDGPAHRSRALAQNNVRATTKLARKSPGKVGCAGNRKPLSL